LALCLSINFSGPTYLWFLPDFTAMKMLFTAGEETFEPKNLFVFKVLKDTVYSNYQQHFFRKGATLSPQPFLLR
jgi:tellurite resistance protein TerC